MYIKYNYAQPPQPMQNESSSFFQNRRTHVLEHKYTTGLGLNLNSQPFYLIGAEQFWYFSMNTSKSKSNGSRGTRSPHVLFSGLNI
jgi:hypothetical protein